MTPRIPTPRVLAIPRPTKDGMVKPGQTVTKGTPRRGA